jgi:hypothetical protein
MLEVLLPKARDGSPWPALGAVSTGNGWLKTFRAIDPEPAAGAISDL